MATKSKNRRALLRSQIVKAWKSAVSKNYDIQRINSERSLQAAVWAELNTSFQDQARRMFIEPGIVTFSDSITGERERGVRYPDLVICNSKEIIGIVELKYSPRVKPNYVKDLATMAWIANAKDGVVLKNYRYQGADVEIRRYKLAASVLYVWAGVHCDPKAELNPSLAVSESFLELHAITRKGSNVLFR